MNRAVFMSRPGTIHNMPKNGTLNMADFEIFTGVAEGLNVLGQHGLFLAIIGSEKASIPDMDYPSLITVVERYIANLVGYPIAFKLCIHHPAKKCSCRLPKPGLITQFKEMLSLQLAQSCMIASRETEIQGAIKAGIKTIVRVSTGRGQWSKKSQSYPIYDTFLEAANYLVT